MSTTRSAPTWVGLVFCGSLVAGTVVTRAADSQATRLARQAIHAGLQGDHERRQQLLDSAVRHDPNCKLAHWQRGEIRLGDRWLAVQRYERAMASDEQLREYRSHRAAVRKGHKPELFLAGWCRRQQLHDAERLHLTRVVQHASSSDADRAKAMRRLGLKNYHGMVLTPKEIERIQYQLEQAQREAAHWTPIIQRWREAIAGNQPRKRRYALAKLHELNDASAIPTLQRLLSVHSEALALEVVAVLGRMADFEATASLVRHSLDLPWTSVRDAAAKQLKQRPLHDYAPLLLDELAAPLRSRFRVSIDADGMVRRAHQLYQEGDEANHLLTATSARGPLSENLARVEVRLARGYITAAPISQVMLRRDLIDLSWRPNDKHADAKRKDIQRRVQVQRELALARQLIALEETYKANQVEQSVAMKNQQIAQRNERVFEALSETTGAEIQPSSATAWWDWWNNYNELYRETKPTYAHTIGRSDPIYTQVHVYPFSCFPAGTPVRTQTGSVPIETVRPGDRVLSQHVDTGELSYKLVLSRTVRPASDLLEISFGEGTITTTLGHPFWVNDVGWRMAKRLKVGYQLQSIDGGQTVSRIQPKPAEKAFNLVVADFGTYFVGHSPSILVHDNTYRKPTTAIAPGLLAQHAEMVP